jgi:hypothetical protein
MDWRPGRWWRLGLRCKLRLQLPQRGRGTRMVGRSLFLSFFFAVLSIPSALFFGVLSLRSIPSACRHSTMLPRRIAICRMRPFFRLLLSVHSPVHHCPSLFFHIFPSFRLFSLSSFAVFPASLAQSGLVVHAPYLQVETNRHKKKRGRRAQVGKSVAREESHEMREQKRRREENKKLSRC